MEIRSAYGEAAITGNELVGYAAVFNRNSQPLKAAGRTFVESIAPGAFKKALSEKTNVMGLWNHDYSQVLGSTRGGTLKLEEDSVGLKFRLTLPETALGKDIRTLVSRGDIAGVSFKFGVREGGDSWKMGDMPERRLLDLTLFEISPTAIPAYPDTTIALRSLEQVEKVTVIDREKEMLKNVFKQKQLEMTL